MKNNVETILHSLQRITPDAGFCARSKAQIIARSQEEKLVRVNWAVALFAHKSARFVVGFASIVLLTTVGVSSYVASNTRSLASSFNNKALAQEADLLDVQIHIKEAVYYDESAEQIALALEEIAK